jgi:type IV pilus assembly protein PilO
LGIALLLLLGYFYYFYFFQPALEKKATLEDTLKNLEIQIAARQRIAVQIKEHKKNIEELRKSLKIALAKLPEQKEISSLLVSASEAGKEAGLEILLFQPMAPVSKEFYAEIPVNIIVQGGYNDIERFFGSVAELPRIVNLTDIAINKSQEDRDGINLITANCFMKTYMFLEETADENKKEAEK